MLFEVECLVNKLRYEALMTILNPLSYLKGNADSAQAKRTMYS